MAPENIIYSFVPNYHHLIVSYYFLLKYVKIYISQFFTLFFFLIKCSFRPQLSSIALTNLQHLFFCIFSLIFLYQNLDNSEHVTQITLEIDRGDFQSKTSED